MPRDAAVSKLIVLGKLPTAITEHYGATMLNVLIGFRFIVERIQQFEEDHSHTFMFRFEKSYGYLVKPFVRNKGTTQALLLLAEVTAYYKEQDKTLYDGLQAISGIYGYYAEKTTSMTMSGQEDSAKIPASMEKFHEEAPTEFVGAKVIQTKGFKELARTDREGGVERLTTPPSDVLKYALEENGWIAIRPSGTKPEIKFYVGVRGNSSESTAEKVATYEMIIKGITEEQKSLRLMEKVVNFRGQSFFKLEVNGLPDTQKTKVEKVSQLFKILNDPTHLKILLYLKGGKRNVTVVTQTVEMEQSAMSHQLRPSRENYVVESYHEGRAILYSLDNSHVLDILNQAPEHMEYQ